MKATEHYFPVVLFIMLYKVVLTFESVYEILKSVRVSNLNLMIETGRYNQTPHDKRLCPVCDSNEIEDEIHFLCYCPKYFKLRNEFFTQIQRHLHNFQQLSYSDLVIKLMNSEDIYLNLRLTNYIIFINIIIIIISFFFVLVFTYLLQYCK